MNKLKHVLFITVLKYLYIRHSYYTGTVYPSKSNIFDEDEDSMTESSDSDNDHDSDLNGI